MPVQAALMAVKISTACCTIQRFWRGYKGRERWLDIYFDSDEGTQLATKFDTSTVSQRSLMLQGDAPRARARVKSTKVAQQLEMVGDSPMARMLSSHQKQ